MEACLRSTVLRMGGRFDGVQFIKPWRDYFPHVSGDDLRAQWHRRLDGRQGRRRTFMVGEVLNLPLVSEVCATAPAQLDTLVWRHRRVACV